MTATNEGGRCNYCWRPNDYHPGPSEGVHNKGCPEEAVAGETEKKEWERGYHYGFGDNYLEPWMYRYYSASFIYGYRVGKAEIDALIEQVLEDRAYEGESL